MNKKQVTEDLWPNNGKIMSEFSDFELEIDRQKNMDWETFGNFLICYPRR